MSFGSFHKQKELSQNDEFIPLGNDKQRTVKQLKKNRRSLKPPKQLVWYNECLKSIREEELNGQLDDDSEDEALAAKQKKDKQLVEEKKIEVQTGKQKSGVNILSYLKNMKNDIKESQKKQKSKPEIEEEQPAVHTKQKKKRTKKTQEAESRKQKKQIQNKKKQKNVRNKKQGENKQKLPKIKSAPEKNIRQQTKVNQKQAINRIYRTHAQLGNIQREYKSSEGGPEDGDDIYNHFKMFEEEQKKKVERSRKIQKLQNEWKMKEKQHKKKEQDKKLRKKQRAEKSANTESQRGGNATKERKKKRQFQMVQPQQQTLKPKMQKFFSILAPIPLKQPPTEPQKDAARPTLNKPLKGKRQRQDPRKQSLKQLIDTFNTKTKSKQLSTHIFRNLFANQQQFATAFQNQTLDSGYFSKCILTPLDHRAVAIILCFRFPKQFFIDESLPFPRMSEQSKGIGDELQAFYEKMYSLAEIDYYRIYLQIAYTYERKSIKSLRVKFVEIMKQKLKKLQTNEQKKTRKQTQQTLQKIQKREKQEQMMVDVRRDNEIRRIKEVQPQQRQRSQVSKSKTERDRISMKSYKSKSITSRNEEDNLNSKTIQKKDKSKNSAQGHQSKPESFKKVIVIDERQKLLDFDQNQSQLDFRASSDDQYSDSSESLLSDNSSSSNESLFERKVRKNPKYESQDQSSGEQQHDKDGQSDHDFSRDSKSGSGNHQQLSSSSDQEISQGSRNNSQEQQQSNQLSVDSLQQSLESINDDSIEQQLNPQDQNQLSDGSLSMDQDLLSQQSSDSQDLSSISDGTPRRKQRAARSKQKSESSSNSIQISMD